MTDVREIRKFTGTTPAEFFEIVPKKTTKISDNFPESTIVWSPTRTREPMPLRDYVGDD